MCLKISVSNKLRLFLINTSDAIIRISKNRWILEVFEKNN